MTPQRQLIVNHNEAAGQYGDCFRACVASILDVPISDVPHRYPDRSAWERYGQGEGGQLEWHEGDPIVDWLAQRGLRILMRRINGEWTLAEVLHEVAYYNPGVHWIIGGSSRSGHGHVCVARDHEVVWDPHPSNDKHLTPSRMMECDHPYWFGYFIGALV